MKVKSYGLFSIRRKKEFVDDDTLKLTIEDNFITVSKAGDIKFELVEIFRERFGFNLKVQLNWWKRRKASMPQRHRKPSTLKWLMWFRI